MLNSLRTAFKIAGHSDQTQVILQQQIFATMVHQTDFSLDTSGHGDMHDITDYVGVVIRDSGILTGTVTVSVVGSTGAVGTIEFEPGLRRDLPEILDKLIPPGRHYGHERAWHDGNAHSHLQATWVGPSITLPVTRGAPNLGTWQQVFFLECDVRARHRSIIVTVIGDA